MLVLPRQERIRSRWAKAAAGRRLPVARQPTMAQGVDENAGSTSNGDLDRCWEAGGPSTGVAGWGT